MVSPRGVEEAILALWSLDIDASALKVAIGGSMLTASIEKPGERPVGEGSAARVGHEPATGAAGFSSRPKMPAFSRLHQTCQQMAKQWRENRDALSPQVCFAFGYRNRPSCDSSSLEHLKTRCV